MSNVGWGVRKLVLITVEARRVGEFVWGVINYLWIWQMKWLSRICTDPSEPRLPQDGKAIAHTEATALFLVYLHDDVRLRKHLLLSGVTLSGRGRKNSISWVFTISILYVVGIGGIDSGIHFTAADSPRSPSASAGVTLSMNPFQN